MNPKQPQPADDPGRRISAAMRAKAERGVMPGCAPMGYKNAWVGSEKVIVIDPETAPMVRRLFELAGRKKWSVRKLVVEAERMGLRSRNGKRIGASAIHVILSNPFYAGMIRYGAKRLYGAHDPIVGVRTFNIAQSALSNRTKGCVPTD